MQEAIKYLTNLPLWFALPVVITTLIVTLWPKVFQIILDLSVNSRLFQKEKRCLELLKLRYEIEAIKKTNNLSDLNDEYLSSTLNHHNEKKKDTPKKKDFFSQPLMLWQRICFGGIGGIIPILFRYIVLNLRSFFKVDFNPLSIDFIGIFIGFLIFFSIGGIGASFLPKKRSSARICVLVGLSVAILFQMFLSEIILKDVPV